MFSHKPYLYALGFAVMAALSAYGPDRYSPPPSLLTSDGVLAPRGGKTFPDMLSYADRQHYLEIFEAQDEGDWRAADKAMGRLNSPLLLGYALADRYLDKRYTSTAAELGDWLSIYADHPQASDIRALALRKSADLSRLPAPAKSRRLRGYGDDNGLAASFGNSPHMATWQKGMKAWRAGENAEAGKLFSKLLDDKKLPAWKVSAAAFWSYRSYLAAGKRGEAEKYLRIAAEEPRSFYGILARKQLGQSLGLRARPEGLDGDEIEALVEQPAVRRIIALSQVGRGDLAEKEMRAIFPGAPAREKSHLLALAHELNLASVQIAMAKYLSSDEAPLDYARYPIPSWQPRYGFKIDPALLFALVRQESGFYPQALSPSGASGLMQIMPQTARYMKKRLHDTTQDVGALAMIHDDKDPTFNMALGQKYVEHLMENPLVEGNLFYLLAAYNAGPGRLMQWKNTIAYQNDPLLFVESIPFAETRNYVMQVMANYWIYSELVGNPNPSTHAVLSGQWPTYDEQSARITLGSVQDIIADAG